MKSFSLSIIIDAILSCLATIILVICLGRLLNVSFSLILPISIIIGLSVATMMTLKRRDKEKKLLSEKGLNENKSQLQFKLSLMSNDELIELFKGLFNKNNITFQIIDGNFVINNKTLILKFNFECLSAQDIIDIKKNNKEKTEIIIVGSIFSENAIMIAKQLAIKLIGIEQVFNLIKNNAPELFTENVFKKSKKKLNLFFRHKHSRKYILYGVALDLMGIISFYPIYYFLFGTFFIISGLVSLFFGIKEQSECLTFENIFDNEKHD